MKITIFTSNQPRHLNLINQLAEISDQTYAIMECNTVFPGKVEDFFRKSEVMKTYFRNVMDAEKKIFGNISFLHRNARPLAIKSGDLNLLQRRTLDQALYSDVYIVFGASFIKGWLADFLVENRALNIHMGVSPYYRGSSCNFWALYDNNPNYVGATIHLLSKGLDSGPMLYNALPKHEGGTPFEFTMRSVDAAQRSLIDRIGSNTIWEFDPVEQDKSQEVRYSRNADFTDDVASEFLERNIDGEQLARTLETTDKPEYLNPFYA